MALEDFLRFLDAPDRVQQETLRLVREQWLDALRGLDDESLLVALRTLRGKITSKKRKAELNALCAALRRDGLPGDAPLPRPEVWMPPPAPEPPEPVEVGEIDDDPLKFGAVIAADPDAPEPYLVYADWLMSQGDPRGQLIAVQHRLRGRPGDRALLAEQAEILAQHGDRILGPLARCGDLLTEVVWSMGFVRSCRLAYTFDRFDGPLPDLELHEAVRWLLDSPGPGRFLQQLTVGLVRHDRNDYGLICEAIGARPRPTLRTLLLGDFVRQECELNWSELGDASGMWPALPRLEALALRAGSMTLGSIVLPSLRSFETVTGGLGAEALGAIANATWPRLERLQIQVGLASQGATDDVSLVAPILDAAGLPALRHLGLTNCEFTEALAELLPSSRILPQLEVLDLSMGTLSDEAAAGMLAHAGAFAHLKQLVLDDNYLSDAIRAEIEARWPCVVFGTQRRERYGRYASAYE